MDKTGFSDQVTLTPGSFKCEQIPEKGLTEQDRLSFVVWSIAANCLIAPVGSQTLTPLKEIRINDAFTGLSYDNLTKLGSYVHVRPPMQ